MPAAGHRQVVAIELGGEPLLVQVLARPRPAMVCRAARTHHRARSRAPSSRSSSAAALSSSVSGLGHECWKRCRSTDAGSTVEDVPAGPSDDLDVLGRREEPPQPREVAVDRAAGALREPVAPDSVQQSVDRHGLVAVDQQRGQDATLPGMAKIDWFAVDGGLDVAQEAELDRHLRFHITRSQPTRAQIPAYAPPTCEFKGSRRFAHDQSPIGDSTGDATAAPQEEKENDHERTKSTGRVDLCGAVCHRRAARHGERCDGRQLSRQSATERSRPSSASHRAAARSSAPPGRT